MTDPLVPRADSDLPEPRPPAARERPGARGGEDPRPHETPARARAVAVGPQGLRMGEGSRRGHACGPVATSVEVAARVPARACRASTRSARTTSRVRTMACDAATGTARTTRVRASDRLRGTGSTQAGRSRPGPGARSRARSAAGARASSADPRDRPRLHRSLGHPSRGRWSTFHVKHLLDSLAAARALRAALRDAPPPTPRCDVYAVVMTTRRERPSPSDSEA